MVTQVKYYSSLPITNLLCGLGKVLQQFKAPDISWRKQGNPELAPGQVSEHILSQEPFQVHDFLKIITHVDQTLPGHQALLMALNVQTQSFQRY